MSITDIISLMNADIFDIMGDPVSYVPVIGDAVETTALIMSSLQTQPSGLGSETWGQITTIELMVSELPDGCPMIGDVVVFGDVEYTIAAVTDNDGRIVKTIVT